VKDKSGRQRLLIQIIRWTARAWTVASIGLILAFLVGEGVDLSQMKASEWLGFLIFPVGICAGMILAWWREVLGGVITIGSLLIFYVVHFMTAGTFPRGWAWLVFAAPGFLFLFCRQRSRSA
jgi:hypothetical protein